jgi:hypothetical protein
MVAMSFHFAECPTNTLVSCYQDDLDPVTKTPAFKTTRSRFAEGRLGAAA